MSSLQELIALGKELGLKDQELRDFIDTEREREKEKERLEREKEKEKERLEREREIDRSDREERQKEREMKREMANIEKQKLEVETQREELKIRKEVELARISVEAAYSNKQTEKANNALLPKISKIPPFVEERDSMDSYIFRFELQADSLKWDDNTKFLALQNLLSGESLKVLHSLPAEQRNYDALKSALLQRYLCTEAGYQHKFRNASPQQGETIDTFISRIELLFSRWLDMAKVQLGNFNALKDLILRDQLFQSLNPEIVTFLKERNPKSVSEIRDLSNIFVTAHPTVGLSKPVAFSSKFVASNHSEADLERGRSRQRHAPNFRSNSIAGDRDLRKNFRQRSVSWDRRQSSDRTRSTGEWRRFHEPFRNFSRDRFDSQYFGNSRRRPFRPRGRSTRPYNSYHNKNSYAYFAQPRSEVPKYTFDRNFTTIDNLVLHEGYVNGEPCSVMRDTGCNVVGVRQHLIKPHQYTGRKQTCCVFGGSTVSLDTAKVFIDTPFLTGTVIAFVLPKAVADVIIGNVVNVNDDRLFEFSSHKDDADDSRHERHANVTTRSESRQQNAITSNQNNSNNQNSTEFVDPYVAKQNFQNFNTDDYSEVFSSIDAKTFRMMQHNDPQIQQFRNNNKTRNKYIVLNDILFRKSKKPNTPHQILVPKILTNTVLKICHDSPIAGHRGVNSTIRRISSRFTWPGMLHDIRQYVKSCNICQKITNTLPPIPIQEMDISNKPFDKVAIDIIGPLTMSTAKSRYVLTYIDLMSRWPEAIPLSNISSSEVANALFLIFSRLGLPKEILSDNAQQLVSNSMNEVMTMMGIDRSLSTPYHPQSNGTVERFNGSLKRMLLKLCQDKPDTWDKMIPAVLFAYRELPNETTGYPPFTLVYGRQVRGPADILADIFTGKNDISEEYVFVGEYAKNMKEVLQDAHERANTSAKESLKRHRQNKNLHKYMRQYYRGDQVLLLLPTNGNNLFMSYQGPFKVISVLDNNNYLIRVGNKNKRYHANIMKTFVMRTPEVNGSDVIPHSNIAFVDESMIEEDEAELQHISKSRSEYPKDIILDSGLTFDQKQEIVHVVSEFHEILNDVPGKTDTISHSIRLTSDVPFRIRQYPLPVHAIQEVDNEIDQMLKNGIIRPSNSPYASPMTVVKKKDGKIRLCIDFRKLNALTVVDAEPIPLLEDMLIKMRDAKVFSKMDLSKGYWQIPLEENHKQYTAFQTKKGLMEFNFMPFGLSTAACTFQKAMQIIFSNCQFVVTYFDDILIFSQSWHLHMLHIEKVLQILKTHGFTIKPSKTHFGANSIKFLGHIISENEIKPDEENVNKIRQIPVPKNKKDVQRLLGLLNYYRRFIPNFSEIALPITELLKNKKQKIEWTEECKNSLETLKNSLCTFPILKMPDLTKVFIVHTDASSRAIGAVLLQQHDEVIFPIQYSSRKLLDREINYAVIEKECLAIVFALKVFDKYLLMKPFHLLSDHKPLSFLKMNKSKNARLTRWALFIQQFNFEFTHIAGAQNILSDLLSRSY